MTVDASLVDRVRSTLVRTGDPPTAARVAAVLRESGAVVGDQALLAVVAAVRSELSGLGPLEPLLVDAEVTDVLVNGPDEVWVDTGDGLRRTSVSFRDRESVTRLAQRLASSAGRRLDTACPTVDARLPDGVRLHAVLPPVAPDGPLLSLRVARRRAFTLAELEQSATVAAAVADVLRALVRRRLAFVVTGGTGSGKTTLLAALLGEVPPQERIVLVEDSGELAFPHPHVVRLEARHPNVEGAGGIDLRVLVRQALRMRPDRLVVGEVRGPEVVDLLAALNTGHEGGCGTVHANAPEALPARLEALALAAGLGRAALHSQLAAALTAVVHVARGRGGRRLVTDVAVLERAADGCVRVLPALHVGPHGGVTEEAGADRLRSLLDVPSESGWP
jgi:pilus assembly protein CpaF